MSQRSARVEYLHDFENVYSTKNMKKPIWKKFNTKDGDIKALLTSGSKLLLRFIPIQLDVFGIQSKEWNNLPIPNQYIIIDKQRVSFPT
jgi:hypothetical protein